MLLAAKAVERLGSRLTEIVPRLFRDRVLRVGYPLPYVEQGRQFPRCQLPKPFERRTAGKRVDANEADSLGRRKRAADEGQELD